jgi:predicted Zn-dependent protease
MTNSSFSHMRVVQIVCFVALSSILSACSLFTPRTPTVFEPTDEFARSYEDIAPEEEHVIGRAVAARILGRYKTYDDPILNEYIAQIGRVLAASSERPDPYAGYSFAILDSDEVNAMATPSGFVFITTGLLRLVDDEDALASILAHEITHVTRRHGLQAIKPENYGSYTQLGGVALSAIDCSALTQQMAAAFSKAVGDVFDTLVSRGYSRQQEYEADRGATEVLVKSGYRRTGMNEALLALAGTSSKSGGWFSTHPAPQQRLTQLGTTASDAPASQAGFSDRRARFKKHLEKLVSPTFR